MVPARPNVLSEKLNMKLKITALAAVMASVSFAPAAFAVNHDETFP